MSAPAPRSSASRLPASTTARRKSMRRSLAPSNQQQPKSGQAASGSCTASAAPTPAPTSAPSATNSTSCPAATSPQPPRINPRDMRGVTAIKRSEAQLKEDKQKLLALVESKERENAKLSKTLADTLTALQDEQLAKAIAEANFESEMQQLQFDRSRTETQLSETVAQMQSKLEEIGVDAVTLRQLTVTAETQAEKEQREAETTALIDGLEAKMRARAANIDAVMARMRAIEAATEEMADLDDLQLSETSSAVSGAFGDVVVLEGGDFDDAVADDNKENAAAHCDKSILTV